MASAAGTRPFLACGIAGLFAALAVVRAEPAPAQRDGSGNSGRSVTVPAEVRDLWREYPLNPTAPAAPRQSRTSGTTEAGSSAAAEAENESLTFALAVGAGAAALGLLALVLVVGLRPAWAPDFRLAKPIGPSARRRRRPAKRPRDRPTEERRRELFDGTADVRPPGAEDVLASDAKPLSAKPKDDKLEVDSAEAEERSDAVKIARSATEQEGGQNESYAQLGEQVASVLAAAQQAAEEIRATALEEAERIRDEAMSEAASTREAADAEVELLRRESEALRTDADEYSRENREAADLYVATTRQQVEDEAARKRAEIDQAARESERAAEQRAREIETEALQRRAAIIEEAERSEARLEQLLGVFRGMTSQLEEVLRAERAVDEAAEAQDESPAGELADELRPRRSRTDPARGSGSPT